MNIKTYRAGSMHEALGLVRRDLGPGAAVLHTREVKSRRLFGLLPATRLIEVTASSEVHVPSRLPGATSRNIGDPRMMGVDPRSQAGSMLPREASPEREERSGSVSSASPAAVSTPPRPNEEPALVRQTPFPPSPSGRERHDAFRPEPPSRHEHPAYEGPPPGGDCPQGQLSEVYRMLQHLCEKKEGDLRGGLPENLFRLFTELIDADLSEEIARELVERVRKNSPVEALDDAMMLKTRVARLLEDDMTIGPPITLTDDAPRVVALVGPTGVGKTTTLAKLAANYRLKEKRRVGLITVDTYRIAAIEQLRTYAEIIDLPMEVVTSPSEMRAAVERLSALDLILIDTAGRSPHDEVKIRELQSFLEAARTDEVHLVLSVVGGTRSLIRTLERFGDVGTTGLIFSKLDEAGGMGNIIPVMRRSKLPLHYLTTGQSVPDDIEEAHSGRLSRLILGVDKLY